MTQHDPIRIIVGLGNPGAEHEKDRHNAGYWLLDELSAKYGGQFRSERKFHGDVARIDVDGCDVRLLKPTTYMNRSGQSVQSLAAFLKVAPEAILVVHDELDLPAGTVRLKRGGGPGGHNGLKDVIAHLGREFFRLRLGIGHPGDSHDVIDYVLGRPSRADADGIMAAVRDALDVIPVLLGHGEQKAMHRLHSRGVEPKPYKKPGKPPESDGGDEADPGDGSPAGG